MATYKAVSIDGDVSFQADVDLTLVQYYFVAAAQEVTLGRWLDTSAPLSASRFGNAFINCLAATGCAPSAS